MSERLINDVDLICIDTRQDVSGSITAIETCLKYFAFKTVKLITNRDIGYKYQHLIPHDTIRSISDYSKFCVYDLWKYIDGTHCLIVQYDGYILNPSAWTDEWLNLDYIGANNGAGGNGGFSLRSKKFCKYVSEFYIAEGKNRFHPEDNAYASWNKQKFILDGIKFGSLQQMNVFSKEHGVWIKQFGFHDNTTHKQKEIKMDSDIKIISAIYGTDVHSVDVLNIINESLKTSSKIKVGNDLFSDPHYNTQKLLKISYSKNDVIENKIIYEHDVLSFDTLNDNMTLKEAFDFYESDKSSDHSYDEIYTQTLSHLKDHKLNILEIGVYKGASLNGWSAYFKNANVYGVDIDSNVRMHTYNDNVKIFICDATDEKCLEESLGDLKFDIIIDDGSHAASHQKKTFEILEKYMKRNSYYFIEDILDINVIRADEFFNKFVCYLIHIIIFVRG